MPIYLLTMPHSGATFVNGLNAAIVYAEDTSLARVACNATYPGGATDLWASARCQEINQSNLVIPVFLASPTRSDPGPVVSVET